MAAPDTDLVLMGMNYVCACEHLKVPVEHPTYQVTFYSASNQQISCWKPFSF